MRQLDREVRAFAPFGELFVQRMVRGADRYPSGSNSRRSSVSPPRQGTTLSRASQRDWRRASSGRSLLVPAGAEPKRPGRWPPKERAGGVRPVVDVLLEEKPSPAGPRRLRTRPTGSTSSSNAAVQRLGRASE